MRELNEDHIALGSWAFGDQDYWAGQQHTDSIKTLQAALCSGIRHIDTAYAYGNGRAEQFLGQQLHRLRSDYHREDLIVATKINTYDEKAVERRVFESMRRLQTDYLDIVYLHWPRSDKNIIPIFLALKDLRDRGIIRFIGASNLPLKLLKEVSSTVPISICQFSYSLLWRTPETGLILFCRNRGILTAGYSPLAQGLLAGIDPSALSRTDPRRKLVFFDPEQIQRTYTVIDTVRQIALETNRSMAQVAIDWTAGKKQVDTMVIGMRTRRQCEEVMQYDHRPRLDTRYRMLLDEASTPIDSTSDNIFHHAW